MRVVVSALALAMASVVATPSLAQELVTNGGFETGALPPFVRASGGVPAPIFNVAPRSGTFHFGDYGDIADALTFQTLTTVPGRGIGYQSGSDGPWRSLGLWPGSRWARTPL